MKNETFVIFRTILGTQALLHEMLPRWSRFRDNWNITLPGMSVLTTRYAIGNLIAAAMNATLIDDGHPEFDSEGKHTVLKSGRSRLTVSKTFTEFFSEKQKSDVLEMPQFVREPTVENNFIYCAIPERKLISIWQFTLFTDPLNNANWAFLSLALFLVCLMAFSSVNGFHLEYISILSVLLTPGAAWSSVNISRSRSILFTLWMLASSSITIIYSGAMGSKIVIPPVDKTFKDLSEVEANKYQLAFSMDLAIPFWETLTGLINKVEYVPEHIVISERMMRNAMFVPFSVMDVFTFLKEFIKLDKVVTFALWPFAVGLADLVNRDVSRKENKNKTDKRCYVGAELFSFEETYFMFIPPKSIESSAIYIQLESAGIITRWNMEFIWAGYSSRVQDRTRFKSKTQMIGIQERTASLTMEGKTVTILLLWATCIEISVIWFCLEVVINRYRGSKTLVNYY